MSSYNRGVFDGFICDRATGEEKIRIMRSGLLLELPLANGTYLTKGSYTRRIPYPRLLKCAAQALALTVDIESETFKETPESRWAFVRQSSFSPEK